MAVVLYGYQYSVYSWIARLVLAEKGVRYEWLEVNPFVPELPPDYAALHPFRRVPALVHDGFSLYETSAITRYIDAAFEGLALVPSHPRQQARINQIIAVIDNYAYWPLIRQVFSNRVFRPRFGLAADAAALREGLAAAPAVLDALENLAAEAGFLCSETVSLADLHAAPMFAYFSMAEEGAALLRQRRRLHAWWTIIAARETLRATGPQLPSMP